MSVGRTSGSKGDSTHGSPLILAVLSGGKQPERLAGGSRRRRLPLAQASNAEVQRGARPGCTQAQNALAANRPYNALVEISPAGKLADCSRPNRGLPARRSRSPARRCNPRVGVSEATCSATFRMVQRRQPSAPRPAGPSPDQPWTGRSPYAPPSTWAAVATPAAIIAIATPTRRRFLRDGRTLLDRRSRRRSEARTAVPPRRADRRSRHSPGRRGVRDQIVREARVRRRRSSGSLHLGTRAHEGAVAGASVHQCP